MEASRDRGGHPVPAHSTTISGIVVVLFSTANGGKRMFVESGMGLAHGDMTPTDALIVRAAARTLFDLGVKLCDHYDPLANQKGLVGVRASEASQVLFDWLRDAEKAGLLGKHPINLDTINPTTTPSRPDWGDDGDNPGFDR